MTPEVAAWLRELLKTWGACVEVDGKHVHVQVRVLKEARIPAHEEC